MHCQFFDCRHFELKRRTSQISHTLTRLLYLSHMTEGNINDSSYRSQRKREFKGALKKLAASLQPAITTTDGQWAIKGFIDVCKNVYTITADTKIVSKILEIHLFPHLLDFAKKNNFKIVLAERQNWYPDFSFVDIANPEIRFAVDLKTTFRRPEAPGSVNGFTLGSHGEYFQNRTSTKNIQFPYGTYCGHFSLGLIYTRLDTTTSMEEEGVVLDDMGIYSVGELGSQPAKGSKHRKVESLHEITSVMDELLFFACEKWELASDKAGSGNTANIGSIKSIDDIVEGKGIFSNFGEDLFDEYWCNYGKITDKKTGKKITNLRDYLVFKGHDPSLVRSRGENRKKRP